MSKTILTKDGNTKIADTKEVIELLKSEGWEEETKTEKKKAKKAE